MSVDVMETTEDIVWSAMSAKEGRSTEPAVRVGGDVSRCASDFGVRSTELATTIPKITAAAIRTEKESARLVDFCMECSLLLWCRSLVPGHGSNAGPGSANSCAAASLPCSTRMHRSMATGIPAASSRRADSGSTTLSCMKKKPTPRRIASSATGRDGLGAPEDVHDVDPDLREGSRPGCGSTAPRGSRGGRD